LVGRRHEFACLVDRWREAEEGEGQVVLISGEPGIGKSRLTLAIQNQIADTPHMTLRYQCSPYHQNSALHPFAEQLARAAGFDQTDTDEQRLDKLEVLLTPHAAGGSERIAVFAEMLSIATGNRYPPLELSAARKKEEILAALMEEIRHLGSCQPLLVVFEDLHWIDPTSLELLDLIVGQAQELPCLVVITFRPEFGAKWTGQAHVTLLTLNRMNRRQCTSMVERLTGGKALPEEILTHIVTRTDGVPLFVEELTKTVLQSDLLTEKSASYALDGPLPPLAIPATLQDSLMARLDQSAPVRELAQLGATIGREFSHQLLARIWPPENEDLDKAIDQLVGSELVFRRGTGPETIYVFKHALIRDTAYESLLHSKRRLLHARIAEVLETRFTQIAEAEPELLAHHLSEAGLNEQAVEYWRRAAGHAANRSANIEAIGHFSKALDSLRLLFDTSERAQQEVELRIALAMVLRVVDRYDNALTVLEEAERVAKDNSLIQELGRVHFCRGNAYFALAKVEGCLKEHERARLFARRAQSPSDEAQAVGGLGDAYYLRGQMRKAREHFGQCVELSRRHGFADIEVANLSMVGFSRIFLNELSGAIEDGLATVEAAAGIHHLRAKLIGHKLVGCVSMDFAKWELCEKHVADAVELAQRLGTRAFEGSTMSDQARALCLKGRRREAFIMSEQAVAITRRSEMAFHGPYVLGVLAMATEDESVRQKTFQEAETILRNGCVSHNYFWFYRDAMDASLEAGNWADADRLAQALEDYTAAAPLPWSSFYIARGRALAATGRGERSNSLMETTDRLCREARRVGLKSAMPALEKTLRIFG
jgi:tetratricopeptide (TPR) repeat protein